MLLPCRMQDESQDEEEEDDDDVDGKLNFLSHIPQRTLSPSFAGTQPVSLRWGMRMMSLSLLLLLFGRNRLRSFFFGLARSISLSVSLNASCLAGVVTAHLILTRSIL